MTCDDYLLEPEEHAAHLATCVTCRELEAAIRGDFDEIDAPRAMNVDALPLAPWEGASHRTWPLVIAGLVAVLALSVGLTVAAGMSSMHGLTSMVYSTVPPVEGLVKLFQHTGQALGAPMVGVLFVVVNTVLVLLLRRAPKGIDA
ncbi:MAG: hypothetical protein JO197_05290 [Acidobacteria bacterium]|nr:hypothetical protein [Acidobacteriota bacterium]MBV9477178.1 hypothetical protein [Acidobacteriota bacterium]